MLEEHKHKRPTHNFDGITENRINTPPKYFSLLFYGLIFWGVIFCAYYLFSGWSSHAEFEDKMAAYKAENQASAPASTAAPAEAQEASASSEALDPEALFSNNCAGCHGADGSGGFGSDLTKDNYSYGKDPADIKASIAEGRAGKMPAFSGQLSDAEIDALVDYVLHL